MHDRFRETIFHACRFLIESSAANYRLADCRRLPRGIDLFVIYSRDNDFAKLRVASIFPCLISIMSNCSAKIGFYISEANRKYICGKGNKVTRGFSKGLITPDFSALANCKCREIRSYIFGRQSVWQASDERISHKTLFDN